MTCLIKSLVLSFILVGASTAHGEHAHHGEELRELLIHVETEDE